MDTFTFADPAWLWLLLLLPLAGWLKGATGTPPAVVYSSLTLVRRLQKIAPQKAGRLLWLLRWLALIVFILALARPQWGEGKQRIRASGIDIVVSMDLSDSMLAEDFQRFGRDANRLDVSKDVLEEFIKRRPSDRIGLIEAREIEKITVLAKRPLAVSVVCRQSCSGNDCSSSPQLLNETLASERIDTEIKCGQICGSNS